MHNEYQRESSMRQKFKLRVCCFSGIVLAHHEPLDDGDLYYNKLQASKTPRTLWAPWTPISPGAWFKKSEPSESGDSTRVRSRVKSRLGRKHHRRTQSADFCYDPSSYALNFEDEGPPEDDEFPVRDFASRLPASPPTLSSEK